MALSCLCKMKLYNVIKYIICLVHITFCPLISIQLLFSVQRMPLVAFPKQLPRLHNYLLSFSQHIMDVAITVLCACGYVALRRAHLVAAILANASLKYCCQEISGKLCCCCF